MSSVGERLSSRQWQPGSAVSWTLESSGARGTFCFRGSRHERQEPRLTAGPVGVLADITRLVPVGFAELQDHGKTIKIYNLIDPNTVGAIFFENQNEG